MKKIILTIDPYAISDGFVKQPPPCMSFEIRSPSGAVLYSAYVKGGIAITEVEGGKSISHLIIPPARPPA